MKTFAYDMLQFINVIKERPCIWDKNNENYKDKAERDLAWEEVCNEMDETYRHMSGEEKKMLRDAVVTRWVRTRDAFSKSLRRMTANNSRKYLYYNQLQFLAEAKGFKETTEDGNETHEEIEIEIEDSIKRERVNQSEDRHLDRNTKLKKSFEAYDNFIESNSSHSEDDYTPSKKVKRKLRKEDDRTNDLSFVGVEDVSIQDSNPRLMNEDEAFFASLLPTVVRYNEDERLEFRMEVLSAMKKIKDKRDVF